MTEFEFNRYIELSQRAGMRFISEASRAASSC